METRSILGGSSARFVVEEDGKELGELRAVERIVRLPRGGSRRALRLGGLRATEAGLRAGRVLLELARAVRDWAPEGVRAAYAVLEGGAARDPERYTGRLGIPAFSRLAEVALLRLPTAGLAPRGREQRLSNSPGAVDARFRELSAGRFAPIGGAAAAGAQPLMLEEGSACAVLEDGRLESFAYGGWEPAARLLDSALRLASARGLAAVRACVPEGDAGPLLERLKIAGVERRRAAVYGCGLERGPDWCLSPSEL